MLSELDAALEMVEKSAAKGLVLRSAKPNGFAAGADIRDFRDRPATPEPAASEIVGQLTTAHRIVDRLAGLKCPTVAVVHGFCLGGGLELALACRHRIAVRGATLGFPEIMLGLHPGLGGTFRLTGLIDPSEAMKMMLTGRSVPARKARSLGLVDAVTEERHVAAAVRAAVEGGLDRHRAGLKASVLGTSPARSLAARQMRAEAEKRAPAAHYPAPSALIDLWEKHGGDREAMQRAEITSFAALMAGDTAQNLIRVFFLRERLKGLARSGAAPARVHVVGAGTMGGDIAAWCARHGVRTTLTDLDPASVARAIGRAGALYDKILHGTDRRDARDRLIPDFAGDGVASADIVIEAIAEKAKAKRQLYATLEPRLKPGAVLATNTSSIPLETLRDGLAHPERLVGLHFFNPVSRMQLVEVVAHDGADDSALAAARALCGAIDRLPAPVASAPGFLVNRCLTPYLLEAMLMLDAWRETRDHRPRRHRLRHGPGPGGGRRPRRPRHLPRRPRDAARPARHAAARPARLAAREGGQGRARRQDRAGPLHLVRQQPETCQGPARPRSRDGRPADPADRQHRRGLPARGRDRRRRPARRGDDLRHRLRPVPRRPRRLRPRPRHPRGPRPPRRPRRRPRRPLSPRPGPRRAGMSGAPGDPAALARPNLRERVGPFATPLARGAAGAEAVRATSLATGFATPI